MACDKITFRRATEEDLLKLAEIEMDAGELLRDHDLDNVADILVSPEDYADSLSGDAIIHLACDGQNQPVGFALCFPVDGEGHLKELSVLRAYMKRGIGRKLIEETICWAKNSGFAYLTLTTYRDLSFNAPLYEKLGFQAFEPRSNWPNLRAIRESERKRGLDVKPRIAMKLAL
ncbi:MAG: GNAT family N-acetyltransferase [Sneathiella sp.]